MLTIVVYGSFGKVTRNTNHSDFWNMNNLEMSEQVVLVLRLRSGQCPVWNKREEQLASERL